MEKQNITIREERISAEEYIDFLKRTDLGSQYPKERFYERIPKLVSNVSISLVARNEEGIAVGVLFGLTDFCYWLYVTDLGVDRMKLSIMVGIFSSNKQVPMLLPPDPCSGIHNTVYA